MKIFVSWSGARSKELAKLLKDWLPEVIQECEPWFSDNDIPSGAVWMQEISDNLTDARFGILCMTPENLDAPWLSYEAGALATKMKTARLVCPLLLDMDKTELGNPLGIFQSAIAKNEEDVYKLLRDINENLDSHRVSEKVLKDAFSKNWNEFSTKVHAIEKMPIPPKRVPGHKMVRDVGFDCTPEEFINHLSTSSEVTILGVTNRNLHEYLDRAWEKRKNAIKTPWNKIEIIFLAQHRLKEMSFPDIGEDEINSLDARNRQWEDGVEKARNFLRSSTNPDKPDGYRARHVEIRSYDKMIPFVGQIYDDKKIRVAYILPDKDIRTSCYLNLERDSPPCKHIGTQPLPSLEDDDSPPCKKTDSQWVNCGLCTWEKDHSPCRAIYDTFRKISTGSTPLFAANVVGWIDNKQQPDHLTFVFSSLRPQNNWRKTLATLDPDRPAHLLTFVLLRSGDQIFLQFRNEKNSSGEFNKFGVLPGKVNDVDFFAGLPGDDYRIQVYRMQKTWDILNKGTLPAEFNESSDKASSMFATKLGISIGQPIGKNALDDACMKAARRSIREKIKLEINEDRLKLIDKPFMVVQGDYELFIRLFVLNLDRRDLRAISNPDFVRKTIQDVRSLKDEGRLTDFLTKYTDDVIEILQTDVQTA